MRRAWGFSAVVMLALLCAAPAAQAAFPGGNGLIAFDSQNGIETVAPDGSGRTLIRGGWDPAWSPDGTQIAFISGGLRTMTADGTLLTSCPCNAGTWYDSETYDSPSWSPDGTTVAIHGRYESNPTEFEWIGAGPPGGGPEWQSTGQYAYYFLAPGDWSHNGSAVYFTGTHNDSDTTGVLAWSVRDPGAPDVLADDAIRSVPPTIAPDGSRLAFTVGESSGSAIESVRPDGTGRTRLSGPAPAQDSAPAWSPDGKKIAFESARDGNFELYVMNADGSNQTRLTNTPTIQEHNPNWQPDPPYPGYPRPKAATPMSIPFVPAYTPCAAPNRVHSAPLSYGSCAPPQQSSTHATTGTPDANGAAANFTGSARLTVAPGDVNLSVDVTDVRDKATLDDYAGELRMQALARATDKLNAPTGGGSPGPGTVIDVEFGPTVPCAATGSATIGSTCSLSTTVNALIPGLVVAGARSNWEFGKVALYDGGTDGDGDTQGDNTLFATQGLFVP